MMKTSAIFYGWWVTLACSLVALWAGGIFFGITAFVNPIVEEFGWSYFVVSLGASLRLVEVGLLAPVVGFLADRVGPRTVIFSSGLIGGAGLILMSHVNSLALYYVAFIVLSFVASGLGQPVITTAIANWFHKKVGRATGFAVAGYGAGGILLPVIVWLIDHYGWRTCLTVLGLSTWVVVLPLSLLIRHKPEQYGYLPDGNANCSPEASNKLLQTANSIERDYTVKDALKTGDFWSLAIVFTLQFMVMNSVTFHIMPYLKEVRMSQELASLVAMFTIVSSVVGRLSFGYLADMFNKRYVLIIALVFQAVGLVFFAYGNALWPFVIFIVLYGPTFGGVNTLRATMVRSYFGRLAFGSIQGILMSAMTIGGIIGPALAGHIFDVQGSYHIFWLICVFSTLVSLPIIATMK